jgi:YD repeat-containing protein
VEVPFAAARFGYAEARVCKGDVPGSYCYVRLFDKEETLGGVIFYADGWIKRNALQGDVDLARPVRYEAGQWVTVRLTWDSLRQRVAIAVNGNEVGENPLGRAFQVDRLQFMGHWQTQPTFHVDDVTVARTQPQYPDGFLFLRRDQPLTELALLLRPGQMVTHPLTVLASADLDPLRVAVEAIDFPGQTEVRRIIEEKKRKEGKPLSRYR